MRQARQHAYTTPGAAALLITPDEARTLFTLPCWALRLFCALIHCADFRTGNGQAGYPELINLLTPDQPERGRRHDVPTRDEIKHMLRRFADVGLIARDRAASEARGNIIFHIQPRTWDIASSEIAARKLARGAKAKKSVSIGAKSAPKGKIRPDTRPHLQEEEQFTPYPCEQPVLSTGKGKARRTARGEKMGPPGGQNIGPDGPRPPPEARTETGRGVGEGSHQGPPGGRDLAPAGHAPRELCDEERALLAQQQAQEIDQARAKWRAERAHEPPGVRVDDPDTWARDEQGRVILPVDHPTRAQRQPGGLRKAALS